MTAVVCPTRKELEALVRGWASLDEATRLREHVAGCSACQTTYDSLIYSTLPVRPGQSNPAFPFLSTPVMPDEMGRLANYRILKVLGQGGMGIVFLAEDIALARPVALKVMRPELKAETDGWKRFLLEARTMASIKHDHLVTVYQAGEERDVAYFAMELLEGESLEARMFRDPPLTLGEVLDIGRQIAKGLAFIHEKNLLHRDIKPANIWLETSTVTTGARGEHGTEVLATSSLPRVKILDLGLVRPIMGDSRLTASGVVMGTPDYMSPEQAAGETTDARSDIFSLGAVLYYVTTGRTPFEGPTVPAVLMALASKTPTTVLELNRAVPRPLSDLIMQMLARQRQRRPASANDVIARLDAIASDAPADASIQPETKPLKKPRSGKMSSEMPREASRTVDIQKNTSNRAVIIVGIAAVCLFLLLLVSVGAGILSWRLFANRPAEPMLKGEETAFLADLKPVEKENWPHMKGPSEFKKKGPKDGPKGQEKEFSPPISYKGQPKPRSIFMHPPAPPFEDQSASLTYSLGRKFRTFEATVSLNDGPPASEAPIEFSVFGDGKALWRSKPVSSQDDAQECKIDVSGVDQLRIQVFAGASPKGAHAVWIEPLLRK